MSVSRFELIDIINTLYIDSDIAIVSPRTDEILCRKLPGNKFSDWDFAGYCDIGNYVAEVTPNGLEPWWHHYSMGWIHHDEIMRDYTEWGDAVE